MNKRITFVDYVRVFACFLVILVHSSENFYGADASGLAGNMSQLLNEQNRLWVSIYDGFSRMSVPLFMIVSAFLLVPLKPGQTMTSFYKRRFLRVVPPMICFMLLYTFLPLLWGGMTWEQSMTDFRHLPFNFPSMAGHLWFMYPLISLYLIIPIVSPWLERSTAKEELIFIGIFAFSTLMPFLRRWVLPELWGECFWNEYHMLWYCSGYLGYLVLAHYIRVHMKWSVSKRLWIGSAAVIIGAAITIISFYVQGVPGRLIETPILEVGWSFCTTNVLLLTFGAFVIFSCIKQEEAPLIITDLAKLSFGIYLVHLFVLNFWAGIFVAGNPAEPKVHVALVIPLMAVLTFICSAIITKIISYIPGHKWVIG